MLCKETDLLITEEDPESPDAQRLTTQLSGVLESITGSSGKNSFQASDSRGERGVFVIGRNHRGEPVVAPDVGRTGRGKTNVCPQRFPWKWHANPVLPGAAGKAAWLPGTTPGNPAGEPACGFVL